MTVLQPPDPLISANGEHEQAPSGIKDPSALHLTLGWIVIFLSFLILRAHTYFGPIHHDSGLFLYAAQAVASGLLPYRDFWDHKPPGLFYLQAIPFCFFPFSFIGAKVFFAFWVSISASLFFCTMRWLVSVRSAILATIYYVLFLSMPGPISGGGLTEECGLVFQGIFYLLVLTHPEATRRHAWLAGFCLGWAVQFRQTFIFSFPILILWMWYLRKVQDRPFDWWIKGCIAAGVGVLMPELVVSGWFWFHDAWYDYLEGSYLFNILYVERGDAKRSWSHLQESWLSVTQGTGPYLVAPLLAALFLPWMNGMHRRLMLVVVLGYIGDLAATILSGEFYLHYYIQAAWPMCIALGLVLHVGAWTLGRYYRQRESRYIPTALLGSCVLAAVAGLTILGWVDNVREVEKQIEVAMDEEGSWAAQRQIGQALAALTEPNETIQLLGRSPNSCYFMARRYAASRYYHNTPIFKSKFENDVEAEVRERFLNDLQAHPPAVYVVGPGDQPKPWRNLEFVRLRIPQLIPMLDKSYIPLDEVMDIPESWWWYFQYSRFWVACRDLDQRLARLQTSLAASDSNAIRYTSESAATEP